MMIVSRLKASYPWATGQNGEVRINDALEPRKEFGIFCVMGYSTLKGLVVKYEMIAWTPLISLTIK